MNVPGIMVEWMPVGVPSWNQRSSCSRERSRFGCQDTPNAQTLVSSTGTHAWPPSGASAGKDGSMVKHGMSHAPMRQ